jgi:hypothetical protein
VRWRFHCKDWLLLSSSFSRWNSLIRKNLKEGLSQVANSKAISLCANVPPYRPDLDIMPIALVDSIHFLGVSAKLFDPASF